MLQGRQGVGVCGGERWCGRDLHEVLLYAYAARACSRVSGKGGGSMDDGRGRMGWAEERESQSPTNLGGGGRVVFMRMLKLQAPELGASSSKAPKLQSSNRAEGGWLDGRQAKTDGVGGG